MKIVDEKELVDFFNLVEKAENNLAMREDYLEDVFNKLERNLVLLGATAVEDKL